MYVEPVVEVVLRVDVGTDVVTNVEVVNWNIVVEVWVVTYVGRDRC